MPGETFDFRGQLTVEPGVQAFSDLVNQPGGNTSDNGIVFLLGEAEGGAPGPNAFTDPDVAKRVLRSGDLLEACLAAFDPSADDDRVPGGAALCICYKTNQSTQSKLSVHEDYDVISDTVASISGKVVTLTTGGLTADAHIGRTVFVAGVQRTIEDNAAGTITLDAKLNFTPTVGSQVLIKASSIDLTHKEYGADTNGTKVEVAQGPNANEFSLKITRKGRPSETTPLFGTKPALLVEYPSALPESGPGQTNPYAGTAAAASTTTQVAQGSGDPDFNADFKGAFVDFLSGASVAGHFRKITAVVTTSGAGTFDWTGALGAQADSQSFQVRTGIVMKGVFRSTTTLTAVLEGWRTLTADDIKNLMLVVTSGNGIGQRRILTSNNGTGARTMNFADAFDTLPAGSEISVTFPGATATATITGGFASADIGKIMSVRDPVNSANRGLFKLNSVDQAGVGTFVKLDGTSPTFTAAGPLTAAFGDSFELHYVTDAVALVNGASGKATKFVAAAAVNGKYDTEDTADTGATTTVIPLVTGGLTVNDKVGYIAIISGEARTISANAAGQITLDWPLGAAPASTTPVKILSPDIAVTFTSKTTLNNLMTAIDAVAGYNGSLGSGVNGENLAQDLDFGSLSRNGTVELRTDTDASNDRNRLWRDTALVVDYLKKTSNIVSAARASAHARDGGNPPSVAAARYMAGGTRGISANANFQSGFDDALTRTVHHIVPVISYDLGDDGAGSTAQFDTVMAQLRAHNIAAAAANRARRFYVGAMQSVDDIGRLVGSFNDENGEVFVQNVQDKDVFGEAKEFPAWLGAARLAGMRAGAKEKGDQLTFAYMNGNGFVTHSSWKATDPTDREQMILAHGVFVEPKDGRGFRIVRELTTWIQDGNPLRLQGGPVDGRRYMERTAKARIEAIIGKKGTIATRNTIKNEFAAALDDFETENLITKSVDETTGQVVPAWRNMRIIIRGAKATCRVSVFQPLGIEAIELSFEVDVPTIS